jgi:geranylgeranyl diphosphate synthase type II
MEVTQRISRAIDAALLQASGAGAPPKLAAAMRHAVLPGGARVRPRLCLAIAGACGDDRPGLSDAAAAAIELLHCASLVHDDLPCFDDADERRGKPSVHSLYGEPLAVLAGDALIVLAFETLGRVPEAQERLAPLLLTLGRSVGMPGGIAAGQAWESEEEIDLAHYHRAKTGSLFVAATTCGALSAGGQPQRWIALGEELGQAYQIADDILDAVGSGTEAGKPLGQDAANARPNSVMQEGLPGALRRLEAKVRSAAEAVPDCRGAESLRALVMNEAKRLVPKKAAASAA